MKCCRAISFGIFSLAHSAYTNMQFRDRGAKLRAEARTLVVEYMNSDARCRRGGEGIRTAEIFRRLGLGWFDQPTSTASQQQFWLVALLRELEAEKMIERLPESCPWRLLEPKDKG
jgi:hypothetical protein